MIIGGMKRLYGKLDEIARDLKYMLYLLKQINIKEKIMSQELDDLESAVNENTELDNSIIQLVNGLATQIEVNSDFPIKMRALAVKLREKSAALSAAIQANTEPVVVTPVEKTEEGASVEGKVE